MFQSMSFKESQLPEDAINTKEIDSIYKFLAHVSININFTWSLVIYSCLVQIDWNEPFMQGLVIFHALSMFLILATRKRVWIQGFLFTVLCKETPYWLVYCSHIFYLVVSISLTERANEWLAANFKLYAKLQYFDSQGMFISLTYSAPVLVNCVIILVCH